MRLFVQRHNEIAATLTGTAEHIYETARKQLIAEYHERIPETFLTEVIHPDVFDPMRAAFDKGQPLKSGKIQWQDMPAMPVEYSAAAYRFGHSMIRESYKLNEKPGRDDVRIFSDGQGVELKGLSPVHLDNTLTLAPHGTSQEDLFFGKDAQRARAIDTDIAAALIPLPDEVTKVDKNLATRNLIRGQRVFKLPFGAMMADVMEVKTPAVADDRLRDLGLEDKIPLWYYVLLEAEQFGGLLGPVGGGIVTGVIMEMIRDTKRMVEGDDTNAEATNNLIA